MLPSPMLRLLRTSCWFSESDYPMVEGVSGAEWTVRSGNLWWHDHVGYYDTGVILYYREQREERDLSMPCGFTLFSASRDFGLRFQFDGQRVPL